MPVAVNGYGCNEIISEEVNGYLYNSGDTEMICARAARTTIVQRFNSKTSAQRYLELYNELGIS